MQNSNKLKNIIREEIFKIFENEENLFNGMLNVIDIRKGEEDWEPLYKFLKSFFQENYKKAANSFMFYGGYKAIRFKNPPTFYQYRHGITRKYFWIDEDGDPYNLFFEKAPNSNEIYLARYEKATFEDTFKYIYKDIIDSVRTACKSNDCETPDDSYLMSYADYRILRDKMLEKAGYKVATIKNKEDIKKFGEENL